MRLQFLSELVHLFGSRGARTQEDAALHCSAGEFAKVYLTIVVNDSKGAALLPKALETQAPNSLRGVHETAVNINDGGTRLDKEESV